jgi:hypothetical protein
VWPLRAPDRLASAVWRAAGACDPLTRGPRWLPVAALAGALPLLLSVLTGLPGHQPLAGALLWLPFLAAVRADRLGAGVGTIAAAYAAHSALAIGLAWTVPERLDGLLPGAPEYWAAQERWITTGDDPEYRLEAWVPAHVGLLAATVVLGYLTLGLAPFTEGFRQVDLMNFYVGRLGAGSESAGVAVGLGWHAWSVCRGVFCAVLLFELASWSFARLTGRETSTPGRRRARWAVGLTFFLLDATLKLLLLEPVRARLAANLAR